MKRPTFLLTLIGVVAILASMLAFKANHLAVSFCRVGSPGGCTTVYLNTSFVVTTTGSTYCTLNPIAPCVQRVVTFVQP